MPFKKRPKQCVDQEEHSEVTSPGREWGRAVADGAVATLSSVKEASDWNPIVKSVLGGANEIVTLCRVSFASFSSFIPLSHPPGPHLAISK
jgi:hypothetical protein